MPAPCRAHRLPLNRAIQTASDAHRTLLLATNGGRDECVIVACVDAARLPLTLFIFDGQPGLDDQLERAVDAVMDAALGAGSPLGAVFLGSSRPNGEPGPTADDEQRWLRMADRCTEAGIELLDWFILSDGAVCSVADTLRPGPGW